MTKFLMITLFAIQAHAAASPSAEQVYLKTAREIRVLHSRLHVGELVTQVQSRLTENDQEVMVAQGGSTWSSSAYARAETSLENAYRSRWARAEASYDSGGSDTWDLTRIIVTNPEEVAGFDSRVASNDAFIRSRLLAFVNRNGASLIRLKELGVLNLAAARKLALEGHDVTGLEETVHLLGDLSFYGANQITSCVNLQTIDRNWTSSSWSSARARASVAAQDYWSDSRADALAAYEGSSSSYWHQFGRNETECSSSVNTLAVSADESVFSVNLSELDALILKWVQSVDVVRLARTKVPLYPTFNSPYFK